MAPDAARADGWLVERWRLDPNYWVVRCYSHISDWSLRCSAAGRTKEWRKKMADGKRRPPIVKKITMQPLSLYGRPGLPELEGE